MADLDIKLREDAAGYTEGLTYGQMIMLQLTKRAWLINGLTMTLNPLNEAGQVQIPVFKRGALKGSTPLCDEGKFNKAKKTFETLLLNEKVSGEFDGCFTVAGTAHKEWERALNNATLMQLALDYQTVVEAAIGATGTASTIVDKGMTPLQVLLSLGSEYFKTNGTKATVALVNSEFYAKLISQNVGLATSSSDFAFVNGSVGRVGGFEIIETDLVDDVTLINEQAVQIAVAANPQQIPQFANIIGNVDMSSFDIGFSAGMISKTDIKPTFVGATTYVHVPFGVKVIKDLVLKYKATATPEV